MRLIIKAVFLSCLVVSTASAVGLDIEPIIGYEMNQKFTPTQHTTNRMTYGARVTLGVILMSIEAEYTRGTDTETFPDIATTIKDTDDKIKLGLRSALGPSRMKIIARGGVQAKQNINETTVSGTMTKTTSPVTYKPYAGAGLRIGLGAKIALTGGVTAVFNDFPDMEKNDYQTTLGLSIKFP